MSRTGTARLGCCLALCLLTAPVLGSDEGARLIEAAQRQQIDEVRKLLEAGADVDARSRYGATPLFFACDKGNVELVKLLLENGAEVDVTDTFYKATPLTWTLFSAAESPPHREIALLLLQRGPADAAAALKYGARQGDVEIVETAVEKGEIEPKALLSSIEVARASGHPEIAEYLTGRAPQEASEAATFMVAPEVLASYAGDFKNEETGMTARVFMEGEELKIQATGQEALTLDATAEHVFTAREVDGIQFTFRGRGGSIEGMQVDQGGQELSFRRVAGEAPAVADTEVELPPLAEVERGPAIQWPRFRGAGASGIGDAQGTPMSWDGESGEGVLWKTAIPGLAHASPIIWDDKVFITSAVSDGGDESLRTGLYGDVDSVDDDSPHSWRVYALDKRTGALLWKTVATEGRPKSKRHLKSTQANPTPATDGEHLVAHFGSQGLYCFDMKGELQWQKQQGALASGWFFDSTYEWGFSSSPILHDGKVITQVDVDDGSFIAAYDLATGREVWKTGRDEIPTWGTPVVLSGAGEGGIDEIVTNGTTIRGYDAENGRELWRLGPNSEITVGSPVAVDGVAYVTGGYPPVRPIYAIRHGGRGDLTLPEGSTSSEHVAWSTKRGGTYIPTPLVYRGLLYMLHNSGRLTVHDAATGELIYRERVGQAVSFSSSPIAADGRIYFTNEDGVTTVVRAGRTYEVLETNRLGEVVMATPAISDGLLVVRTAQHVYGLGERRD